MGSRRKNKVPGSPRLTHREVNMRQTMDSQYICTYQGPPFQKTGDPFKSTLLRRFYFDRGSASYVWVDDRGNLVKVGSFATLPYRDWPSYNEMMDYIDRQHCIKIVPFGFEGTKFWAYHPSSVVYCQHGTKFPELV